VGDLVVSPDRLERVPRPTKEGGREEFVSIVQVLCVYYRMQRVVMILCFCRCQTSAQVLLMATINIQVHCNWFRVHLGSGLLWVGYNE